MGFFSVNCKCCGHPLLSHYVTNATNRWMEDAVIVRQDGSITKGEYDGYGRVGGVERAIFDAPNGDGWEDYDYADAYHLSCWKKAGEPTEYTGGSENAEDQGFFFNDPDHNMADPMGEDDVKAEG